MYIKTLNFTSVEFADKVRLLIIFCVSLILRLAITQYPYSGQNKFPTYGDYEAQRHWQEVTLNLPVKEWYINSSRNNLDYWGLDYPPLTAYHSLILGYIAHSINPKYVALHKSQGYESNAHKYFMRMSVVLSDILIYIPAMLFFVLTFLKFKPKLKTNATDNIFDFSTRDLLLATILFYPGLILIDHGHFQYNCVSLGMFVAAVTAILNSHLVLASVLFVSALNYKQMELYHALPFFFYILGLNLLKKKPLLTCLRKLAAVSFTVILTMIVIWCPFTSRGETVLAVIIRLFPLARGIFEDKVANIWCAINVVYKLRETFTNIQLAHLCLFSTTMALLPSCLDLCFRPSKDKFIVALINSSLAFFLFSFQVHEKSILLVAIPVLMHFYSDPLPCFWFLMISTFSMLPLLIKDGLVVGYFGLRTFYAYFINGIWFSIKQGDKLEVKNYKKSKESYGWQNLVLQYITNDKLLKNLLNISMKGMDILSVISIFLNPPKKYPDLYALLISVYACVHFIIFFLYFNYKQIFTMKEISRKMKIR